MKVPEDLSAPVLSSSSFSTVACFCSGTVALILRDELNGDSFRNLQ